MKKKIYLAMLAVCFALTASACGDGGAVITDGTKTEGAADGKKAETGTTRLVSVENVEKYMKKYREKYCLLYTSPSPRDRSVSRMPSSA